MRPREDEPGIELSTCGKVGDGYEGAQLDVFGADDDAELVRPHKFRTLPSDDAGIDDVLSILSATLLCGELMWTEATDPGGVTQEESNRKQKRQGAGK